LFLDPRQREQGQVLFQKSVGYEADGISVINADIREAGKAEAELRISSNVTEVASSSRNLFLNFTPMFLVAAYLAVLPS
jgi:hypothetical protein